MPPPVLASQSRTSAPGLITPANHIYTQDDSNSVKQSIECVPGDSQNYWTAPFRDGLPTPPNDMTGVAYNAIPSSSYGGQLNRVSLDPCSTVSNTSRMTRDPLPSTMVPYVKSQSNIASKNHGLPDGPVDEKRSCSGSVAPYLQIPSSIKSSKGNLAEFAAQMTCLFWFESAAKLASIEGPPNPFPSLGPEAVPSTGFQKWVSSVLSTTQVSQNVTLLALLFIYRLKKFNPGVKGKKGSEFRLMTIALMLGNKFLDDNTYTNKTWAEVSGISVQEIHIMEVEFLSNVRYNLFASEAEWATWQKKLGLFADYFNRASIVSPEKESARTTPGLRISPTLGPTPRMQSSSPLSKLPSPPIPDPTRQSTLSFPPNGSSHAVQPRYGDVPPVNQKRTRDEELEDRPAKRPAISHPAPTSMSTLPPASALTSIPALPPVLTPTSAPSDASMSGVGSRLPYPNFQTSSGNLAPSIPTPISQTPSAGRALPVYNPTSWAPPVPSSASSAAVTPVPNVYNPMSLPNPVRHHQSPLGISSSNVSPALSAYSVHTPQTHLSPSFFLANRYSPYRPVRAVNTLLYPPPSGSMQQQRSVPFNHMHYQPLGKGAAERKTGRLPYIHSEAWSHGTYTQPLFNTNPGYSG